MGITFSKFHASYVVGVVDIVRSTELISRLSAEETDTFFTLFLSHFTQCISHTGAVIIKNIGDGFLFYLPGHDPLSDEEVDATLACADAIIACVPGLNEKLQVQGMGEVSVRLSMSYGPVSAMLNTAGEVVDIFGSTVSTCAKMNKMGEPNRIVMGSLLADYVREKRPLKELGVFTASDTLTFPVFEISA